MTVKIEDDSPNGLYYSALHEQSTQQMNAREQNADRRIAPYKIYETTDGNIVAATRMANADYIKPLREKFNDYARVGTSRNLLATPTEITPRGKEVAAERGVPATFTGLSGLAKNRRP